MVDLSIFVAGSDSGAGVGAGAGAGAGADATKFDEKEGKMPAFVFGVVISVIARELLFRAFRPAFRIVVCAFCATSARDPPLRENT